MIEQKECLKSEDDMGRIIAVCVSTEKGTQKKEHKRENLSRIMG